MERNKLIDATMHFAREDKRRSWYYFVSTVTLAAAAITGTLVLDGVLRIVCSIFIALFMVRLFVIYHDFRHDAILRHSGLAKAFMTFFGIVSLAPASIWSESHDHHHLNNSKFSTFVVGSFPIVSTRIYRSLSRAGRLKYLLIRHPLMILFAYVPIFLVSFCLWPFFENPGRYWDCGLAAAVHVTLAVALYYFGGWPMVLFTLLIPSVIMYAIGGYLFYAQHNFRSVRLSETDNWEYFEAALYSSSHIRMSRFMNWVTANIGYHHVHHVNPRIPFYRLPEAMTGIPELSHPLTTSLHPVEIMHCLRLKLWDDEQQRLVTLREFREKGSVQFV